MKIKITTPNGYSEFISDEKCYLDIEVGDYKRSIIIYKDGMMCEDNEERTEI